MRPRREPPSEAFHLRLPKPLLTSLTKIAAEDRRSIAFVIREMLADAVQNRKYKSYQDKFNAAVKP